MTLNVYSHELMENDQDFRNETIVDRIEADSFEEASVIANERYGSNDYSWAAEN